MTPRELAGRPDAWDDRAGGLPPPAPDELPQGVTRAVAAFCEQLLTIAWAETRKLRRDPTEVFTRAVQPVLWLGIFGVIMNRAQAIPTGSIGYLDFLVPGILAQSVLFVAIFYGISLIWERDLGILHKYLASPAYRSALVAGKAVSAGIRALLQGVIVGAVAFLMGAHLRLDPGSVLAALLFVVLGAAVFSTFSLTIACLVKTRERFMGIGQVLTMPLFFASNAIYPLSLMPKGLRLFSRGNPLTYQVDALRGLMIQGGQSAMGYGVDAAVEIVALLVLIAIAARLYPTTAH
ncbi:MAG TPA: ABC transporter permease [Anaeromyxobacter sp.]|nr:ABC transporter permease [Anaeromyxobacter sp.]